MIANPFPPMASAGNARLLRFLRHLPANGWEATVLTAKAKGPVPVPEGVRVERAAAPGPESLYALARKLRPSRQSGAGAANGSASSGSGSASAAGGSASGGSAAEAGGASAAAGKAP